MVPSLNHPLRKRPQRNLARPNIKSRAVVVEQLLKSERVLGEPRVGPEALRVVGQGGTYKSDVRQPRAGLEARRRDDTFMKPRQRERPLQADQRRLRDQNLSLVEGRRPVCFS